MADANIETRIKDGSHITEYLQGLQSLWQSGQFCDLTLKVGNFEFKAHKVVLATCSQYFKNMLEEPFSESAKNYVELPEVDAEAFKIILEYFYSGYVTLTQSTTESILCAADFFVLTAVKTICCEYLSKSIRVSNCIRTYYLGVIFGFHTLKTRAKSFIMQHLDEVSKLPDFYAINQGILKDLLMSNKGIVKPEKIYNATMEWIRYDLDDRKFFLSHLLELIPAEEIGYDFYIENMKNDQILRQDFKCMNWLLDNIIERFVNVNLSVSCSEDSIFITSLLNNNPICYQFKLESKELVNLPPRSGVIGFSVVCYKNGIYLVTGVLENQNAKISFKYNTSESKWSEIDTSFERYSSGACVLRDHLYVIGGVDKRNSSAQNSCLYYDFSSGHKYSMPDMKKKRVKPGVVVYENSIYVCCGRANINTELPCIQRYDPREGIWYAVGNWKVAKGYCSSAVITTWFYTSVLGEEIVERFDFRNNNSEEITKPSGNCYCGWITCVKGKLLRAMEKGFAEYDDVSNKWLTKECEFNDLVWPVVVTWPSM